MAKKQTEQRTNRETFLRFEGSLSPRSVNAEERTCSVVWYTGARVERYSWSEGRYMLELSMEPDAVDISRLTSGTAPLLNAHSDYTLSDVIGVIENARIENGVGYAYRDSAGHYYALGFGLRLSDAGEASGSPRD